MKPFRAILLLFSFFSHQVTSDPLSLAESDPNDFSIDAFTVSDLTTRANNFPVRAGERSCLTCQVASKLLVPFCPAEGIYSHFVSCKDYYVCDSVSEKPVALICPRNELFDKFTGRCKPPRQVDCKGDELDFGSLRNDVIAYRSQTPRINLRPTRPNGLGLFGRNNIFNRLNQRSNVFICPSIGLFPDPEDCSAFFSCYIGAGTRIRCPPGLIFNRDISVCDYPENTACLTGTTTPAPVTTAPPFPVTTTRPTTARPTTDPTVPPTSPPDTVNGLKRVCYYTNWARYRPEPGKFEPEDINRSFCTHIIYAFAVLDANTFLIKSHDPWADIDLEGYKKVTMFQQFGMKVLLAIGGWTDSAGSKYSELVASRHRRENFITHVVDFLNLHNFDGLDLDWEFPRCWQSSCVGPVEDKENFVQFVKELRVAFNRQNPPLLLSAAMSANPNVAEQAYDIRQLSEYLDFMNLMSYDYHGSWDKKTGHVSPLKASPRFPNEELNINKSVAYYINKGASRSKIILGFPTYGRSFTLNDPNVNGYNAPASAGAAGPIVRERGTLSYVEICQKIQNEGWTKVNGDESTGPYAFSGNQWVSYMDIRAIAHLGNYIVSQNLGGAMVWALDFDDFNAICCPISSPIMSTIERLFKGDGPGVVDIINQCDHDGYEYQEQIPMSTVKTRVGGGRPATLPTRPSSGSGSTGSSVDCSNPEDLFQPDPATCTSFFSCSNGKGVRMSCPAGLYWSQAAAQCDWPQNVVCPTGKK